MLPTPAFAGQLPDGTPISVRLVGFIDSERSKPGDPVAFVVAKDIVAGEQILVGRGTPVSGIVVQARRVHWGFSRHRAKLAFAFTETSAGDGQVIRLRAYPTPTSETQVVLVDRARRHHDIQWVSDADTFTAYVDGDYAF